MNGNRLLGTNEDRWHKIAAAFAFLVPLLVYLRTLTPTVPFWDSGEFIATSFILGLPHPPGNPVYTMLGRVMSLIPIGSVAWKVNFMSALASALTYDMIYTQPIAHDLPLVRTPALLVIGQSDRTVVGRQLVSKEILATLGNWPELGKKAAAAIPGARLVPVPDVGHIPHLEAPEKFNEAVLGFLR